MSAAVHERALDVLEGLYGLAGAELRALLVLAFELVPPPLPDHALARTAYMELGRFLDARSARPAPVRPAVRIGEASVQIVDEVADWNADLLVVGTHGRRGLPRLWLGSVAEACIRDAPCSVLAIPPMPRRRRWRPFTASRSPTQRRFRRNPRRIGRMAPGPSAE
jgi:nucleotide-binding universal stress UspA family protein